MQRYPLFKELNSSVCRGVLISGSLDGMKILFIPVGPNLC